MLWWWWWCLWWFLGWCLLRWFPGLRPVTRSSPLVHGVWIFFGENGGKFLSHL